MSQSSQKRAPTQSDVGSATFSALPTPVQGLDGNGGSLMLVVMTQWKEYAATTIPTKAAVIQGSLHQRARGGAQRRARANDASVSPECACD